MRGRVALHKSQPEVVSDPLGDRSGSLGVNGTGDLEGKTE